jgi:PIN domain nuclease of toxin-antitoxin system
MSRFVLDTSAVLALFWQEPGWARVSGVLEGADHAICAVNLAELVTKLSEEGIPQDEIPKLIHTLQLNVRAFDAALALVAGNLRQPTRHLGLSLGDRACLALAQSLQATVITADRPWLKLELGIAIECIRD